MQQEEYYRRYGVKTSSRLKNPDFLKTNVFTLPHNALLAFYPHTDTVTGPNVAWQLIANCDRDFTVVSDKRPLFIDGARKITFNLDAAVKEYHQKNRRFTKMRNIITATRNKNTVVIENYALLKPQLTYPKSWYRSHTQAVNFFSDVFNDLSKQLVELPEHVCFLPLEAPTKSYDKADYNRLSQKVNQETLEIFDSSEALLQAYLYQYLTFAERVLDKDESLKEDKTFKANPWSKLDEQHFDRIWLTPVNGDSLGVVSMRKLVELVAKEDVNLFVHFCNAVHEENTGLVVEEDKEVIFGDDGKVIKTAVELEPDETPEQALLRKRIRERATGGNLSIREQNFLLEQTKKVNSIKAPNSNQSLVEFAKITPEELAITPTPEIPPHPMSGDTKYQRNSNVEMIKQYNDKLMHKDVVRSLLSFQSAGLIITDLNYELRKDAAGAKHFYAAEIMTDSGKKSTFYFDFPVVEDSGRFQIGGTEVFYTPQRSDVPIRKIKPHQVKLTSYDGSMFITRGRLTKNNYNNWLLEELRQLANDNKITIKTRNVADKETAYPRVFTLLGTMYQTIQYKDVNLQLSPKINAELFKDEKPPKGQIPIGRKGKQLLTMDQSEVVYVGGERFGLIEELLEIDTKGRKIDSAEVKVFSKQVPLGLVLGQRVGLRNLIKRLGIQHREFITGERGQVIGDDEYKIEFSDKTLVFSTLDRQATLILNSLNLAGKHIKAYNIADFDKPDVYFSVLEDMGLGLRYFLEIDAAYDLFLDPIAVDLLEEMGEPTNMTELYIRAAELLTTDHSPHEIDPKYMRDRHYERFVGFAYKALADAERVRRSRPAGAKAPISVDPKRVIMNITTDSSKNMVETANPIRNVREKSFISYAGEGGRTAQTMTPELRIFHPNELGHTSVNNTADSGKVAINASRVHNPLMKNLRGRSEPFDKNIHDETNLFTTAALYMPGVDRDELKRLNFVDTQGDSVYPTKGQMPMPLHTPMEYEYPYLVDKEFAAMAKEDGKVLSVTELGIKVLYKSGEEDDIVLGRIFGRVAGTVVPHEIITDLKPGNRFKHGDALAWNTSFFARDIIQPNKLAMLSAHLIPTLFAETVDTFEDSTTFWDGLGKNYLSDVTKERYYHLPFDTEIQDMLKVGAEVEERDVAFVKIPPHLQGGETDSGVIASLKELNKDAPKIDAAGVVEKIEVFYFGQKDEMHASLRTLANASDRHRKLLATKHGQKNLSENGMVTSPVNFGGTKIEPNHVMIKVYVTKKDIPLVSGSKTVMASQLKNTVSQTFPEEIEIIGSDEKAHCYFSYNGQNNRIVLSALEQGLGNRALVLATEKVVSAYRGE